MIKSIFVYNKIEEKGCNREQERRLTLRTFRKNLLFIRDTFGRNLASKYIVKGMQQMSPIIFEKI